MRLTLALLKRKMPNGAIWNGKHRLRHYVYPLAIERFVKRLQVEENNMLLLRNPYLTLEQDRAYIQATQPWDEVKRQQKLDRASSHCKPSVRMEESLNHLMNTCKWDV